MLLQLTMKRKLTKGQAQWPEPHEKNTFWSEFPNHDKSSFFRNWKLLSKLTNQSIQFAAVTFRAWPSQNEARNNHSSVYLCHQKKVISSSAKRLGCVSRRNGGSFLEWWGLASHPSWIWSASVYSGRYLGPMGYRPQSSIYSVEHVAWT